MNHNVYIIYILSIPLYSTPLRQIQGQGGILGKRVGVVNDTDQNSIDKILQLR